MEDLRIVRGNDFYLKVPVSRVIFQDAIDGSKEKTDIPMPLDECTDVRVNLVDEGGDAIMPLQYVVEPIHREVVYDITEHTGERYESLADALGSQGANVPYAERAPRMSVSFKRDWYRVKREDVESHSTGMEITTPTKPTTTTGVYLKSQLSTFSVGGLDVGESALYWYDNSDPNNPYTTWTITRLADDDLQYWYLEDDIDDATFAITMNWRKWANLDRLLIVKVYGKKMDLGWYGLEVTGKYDGRDFRSYERKTFKIVENNGKSFVSGETYNGEVSYQIDTMWTLYAQASYPFFELDTITMNLYQYGVVENGQMGIDEGGNLIMNV